MTDLEHVQQLYGFLQGKAPEGYRREPPKLGAEAAWTAVWFAQNSQRRYSDEIERCGVCGDLFDSANGGGCLDYGKPPYHFCDECLYSSEYQEKKKEEAEE